MIEMAVQYVHQTPEGGWRLTGSRVSLDSVIHVYRETGRAEAVVEEFPTLSLEQVFGALAFYLRHQEEIDRYLAEQAERWEQFRQESEQAHATLLKRLRAARPLSPPPEESA